MTTREMIYALLAAVGVISNKGESFSWTTIHYHPK